MLGQVCKHSLISSSVCLHIHGAEKACVIAKVISSARRIEIGKAEKNTFCVSTAREHMKRDDF